MEALTSGLAGLGRKAHTGQWSASIYLQLIDPDKFGGKAAFIEEIQHFVEQCKASDTHPQFKEIRLPGERALALKRKQMAEGIMLHPEVYKRVQEMCCKIWRSF